jgi:Ser/Thr protein kinase RdoA (MazF antagonist)
MEFSATTSGVTATRSSLAGVPVGLLRALEERYGLEGLEAGERLAGGYANDIFRLDGSSGPLVVRLQHPPLQLERLGWEHDVVRRLAERMPEVPAPLAARDGRTFFVHDRFAVWLLPFVHGAPGGNGARAERVEAAALLGRLHRAGRELGAGPWRGQKRLADLAWPEAAAAYAGPLAGREEEAAAARSWAVSFVAETDVARRPSSGLVHGDYFPGNVLFRSGRAVALLDWEELAVDWTAYDLASGLWEFSADASGDLDREAMTEFAAAYRDAGGTVPPEEDDLLVPLIRVKRIVELLRMPTDRHVDLDYHARNLDAFWSLGRA